MILKSMASIGLNEEVVFDLKVIKEGSHVDAQGKNIPGQRNSQGKAPN